MGSLIFVPWALTSPAVALFLLATHPLAFHHQQNELVFRMIAALAMSYLLVTARLKKPANAGLGVESRADWRAIRIRRAAQTGLLLATASAVNLALLGSGFGLAGRQAGQGTQAIYGTTFVIAVVALVAFRAWDRWSPPLGEPVTVAAVQKVTKDTRKELRKLQDQNRKVEQMAAEIAEQIRAFRSHTQFVAMRNRHFESFSCANVAHGNYRSAQTSSRMITGLVGRAEKTCAPRIIPLRDPQSGRRERPDRAGLIKSGAELTRACQELDAAVARGLRSVHTLNMSTAELRDLIRDNCGEPGRRWHDALDERKRQAKAAS
jgi:hypothetical protein